MVDDLDGALLPNDEEGRHHARGHSSHSKSPGATRCGAGGHGLPQHGARRAREPQRHPNHPATPKLYYSTAVIPTPVTRAS